MSGLSIGATAPSFRLPSAQGPEVGLDDFRGRSAVVLWFTKGMACGFCRQQMSQLARGYPRFRDLGAELLQITPTKVERGRFYARNFTLAFPYLCDPDRRAAGAYGLGGRSHSVAWYAQALVAGARSVPPPSDFPAVRPSLGEMPALLADDDMGFFIVDREGIVRHALGGSYVLPGAPGGRVATRPVPGNDEITRELERLAS